MAENSKNARRVDIFKRLTQLFRSGNSGALKKRVKTFRPPVASTVVDTFKKSYAGVYANAMNAFGSYDRLARIADASEMDYTAEISAALDVMAEESTSVDDKNRVLHVYSNNQKIHSILSELLYDTLNIEYNIANWARNLVKYGDVFAFFDVHPEHGIINVYPLPVNEVERDEGYDPDDPAAFRFRWTNQGNMILEAWQVAHFRLLGNDAFLPYGCSVLEGARRIWRQLILIEDAMLVYRVVRSPERRVFYIDVGAVPNEEIATYMELAESKFKKAQVINKTDGRSDMRFNALPIRRDTEVPLLDGRVLTIEQLAQEYDAGKTNWVYSVQDGTKRVVPGRVDWCGKNYACDRLHRVWLDDGSYVDTAPEHPFVMSDGTHRRADELEQGDSLMAVYRDLDQKGYELLIEPDGTIACQQVVRVEVLTESDDVYCMTVRGPKGEDDRHNFGISGHNLDSNHKPLIILRNSVDEDFFIPVRGGESGTKIDTLAGGQHVSDIADVEYLQKKLFAALKVPRAYLGFDDSLSSKSTLAQLDIRFSRSIARIQRVLISELEKMCMIHLFIHGYEGEDLVDFSLALNNPSTVAQMQKLELWRTKFDIAATVPEGLADRDFIRREIFQLSDYQISKIKEGRRRDRLEDLELEASELEGNTLGGSGGGGGGGLGGLGSGLSDLADTGESPEAAATGGESGAEASSAPGGDEGGDEGAVDLFAGDVPEGDVLVAGDDNTSSGLSLAGALRTLDKKDDDVAHAPVNVSPIVRRTYNRKRHRHHGPQTTEMPAFSGVLSVDNDTYDKRHFHGSPFKDAILGGRDLGAFAESVEIISDEESIPKPRISSSMRSVLRRLETRLHDQGFKTRADVLTEALDASCGSSSTNELDSILELSDDSIEIIED